MMLTDQFRIIEHAVERTPPNGEPAVSVLYYTIQERTMLWNKIPLGPWESVRAYPHIYGDKTEKEFAYKDAACLALEDLKLERATKVVFVNKVISCGGNKNV